MLRAANAGTSTMWTITTAPRTLAGSSPAAVRIAASMPGYSPPCTPAVIARRGPGARPLTTVTGISIGVPGTARTPVTLVPGVARSAPTVRVSCPIAVASLSVHRGRVADGIRDAGAVGRDRRPQIVERALLPSHGQGIGERRGDRGNGLVERDGPPEQARHRCHRPAEAARVDEVEGREIRIDVQREPVHRDFALDGNPDGRHLCAAGPYAGETRETAGLDPPRRERGDERRFERADVPHHVLVKRAQVQDGIPDELAGPVIRDV